MNGYECVSVWLRLGPRVRARVRPYVLLLAARPQEHDALVYELLDRRAETLALRQLDALEVARGVVDAEFSGDLGDGARSVEHHADRFVSELLRVRFFASQLPFPSEHPQL